MSWPLAYGSVCVVPCTVCTYSVRCVMHFVHLQRAWRCALCSLAVWYSRSVWTLPTISGQVNSQRGAASEKPVVSHLAKNFRTSHVIQKFIVVLIGARHISTSRASWIQSMPSPIISLISFLILYYHLRLRLASSFLFWFLPYRCVTIHLFIMSVNTTIFFVYTLIQGVFRLKTPCIKVYTKNIVVLTDIINKWSSFLQVSPHKPCLRISNRWR
jgi:hypothetical protein